MLTFIRGAGTFYTAGQVYVKLLPAGTPVQLTSDDMVYATGFDSSSSGKTYVLPVLPDRALPDIPPGGFHSDAEIAAVPGVRIINYADVSPGLVDSTYAFSVGAVQRNLYRIPLP